MRDNINPNQISLFDSPKDGGVIEREREREREEDGFVIILTRISFPSKIY